MGDRLINVDHVHETEQRKGVECTVEEARVLFTPAVSGKSASLWILQIGNDCQLGESNAPARKYDDEHTLSYGLSTRSSVLLHLFPRIKHGQYLD